MHRRRLGALFSRDLAIVARRCGNCRNPGIGRLRILATDALPAWQRTAVYLGLGYSRRHLARALDAASTSRFHLSRAYRCTVRQVELVSVCGIAGRPHIFFPSDISCSARAAAKQTHNSRCLEYLQITRPLRSSSRRDVNRAALAQRGVPLARPSTPWLAHERRGCAGQARVMTAIQRKSKKCTNRGLTGEHPPQCSSAAQGRSIEHTTLRPPG